MALPLQRTFEHALVPLAGTVTVEGEPLTVDTLYVIDRGRSQLTLRSVGQDARLLLIGGAPFGESILMWWNFVARAPQEIAAAREDWEAGRRFGEVRRYAGDRLPAPRFAARPVPPNPAS
jgi:redox-sensitive bicupin YhaK (pirin superfamily)